MGSLRYYLKLFFLVVLPIGLTLFAPLTVTWLILKPIGFWQKLLVIAAGSAIGAIACVIVIVIMTVMLAKKDV